MKNVLYDFSKALSLLLFFLIVLCLLQVVYSFLKSGHDIRYQVTTNGINYQVNEELVDNSYIVTISSSNGVYKYQNDSSFNKQTNIVANVLSKEIDGYHCIFPLYDNSFALRNINYNDIECIKDNILYTSQALEGIVDFKDFRRELVDAGYKFMGTDEDVVGEITKDKYMGAGNTTYYENSSMNGIYISEYENSDVYIFTKEWESTFVNSATVGIDRKLEESLDVRKYMCASDKYFFAPKKIMEKAIVSYEIIDITNVNIVKEVSTNNKLSTDSYVTGCHDGKMYIYDRSMNMHYVIDPEYDFKEFATGKDTKYFDGSRWKSKTLKEFGEEGIVFERDLALRMNANYAKKNQYATYYVKDNVLYKVFLDDMDNKLIVAMFDKNITSLDESNNYVLFTVENDIYVYNDLVGIRKIGYKSGNSGDIKYYIYSSLQPSQVAF